MNMLVRLVCLSVGAFAAMPSATAQPAVIASQDTNWTGVVLEVTEFVRKGNTLTVKLRLRNSASTPTYVDFGYREASLLDTDGAKKYQVLTDDKEFHIAALTEGFKDRWRENVPAGQSRTLWMKFPAPPATVSRVTLQLPSTPPFEDLPIQDRQ